MQTEELLSPPQTCWWNGFGIPPLTTESLAYDASDSFTGVKVSPPETEQAVDKLGSATLFTLSSGGGKSSRDVSKPHVTFSMQSTCLEFGFTQPTIYTKNPYVAQYYGVVSAYGPQKSTSGRVMLPLNMETEEYGPIYVNSKQYHGIIRRRQSRAKAVLKNKLSRCRKPYMHHSRHLHAMRRPRGSGGRFLNTKKVDATKQSKPINSQSSVVFHSENGTMTSSREADMPNLSGSQVTSMDYFLGSSVHSLECMVMPSKWIAAAMDIDCCNLRPDQQIGTR